MAAALILPPELAAVRPLSELAPGEVAQVVEVGLRGDAGERLLELGLTPGAAVRLVRRGWLGDPLLVEVRGAQISLRKGQATGISIRRV